MNLGGLRRASVPFELSGEVLGQDLSEALSSDAVVSVGVENPEYSSIDLQHGHTQRRSAQLVHQDVTVNTAEINMRASCWISFS